MTDTAQASIVFPPELPVSRMRAEISALIRDHQVVIVAGETGSGKTTQLPKICLELGRKSIAHTQPRRLAARTIAERIAEELGDTVGGLVGYQVRFTDRVGKATRIKLMTDGILLNEIHRDALLTKYDTIVIDEAHERSLNIDFLLGYLRRLLPKRPDLKLVITSATIDPQSFSEHFGGAPVIEVSGRTYPVEIRYRPLTGDAGADPGGDDEADDSGDGDDGQNVFEGITAALDELARAAPGDVLVFLSGENEIRDAEDAVRGHLAGSPRPSEVLPLYGRLSAADQHRVFSRTGPGVRRIVLATNVAETSLTVPGIKYVIDSGTARISRYSTRSKVQRLPIEPISQASANQRSGRSGRTSPGIAIRLYSQEDFDRRPQFTEPEILRTNLAAVILQMLSLGLGEGARGPVEAITAFPFLTPPDPRGIKAGLDLLSELGAITAKGTLTRAGRELARLPIEPRFARMVVEAKRHGVGREVLAIVAGLTIQDPRERPLERRGQADALHARFTDPTSDFLTLLNLWNHLEDRQRELSSSAFRRLCKAEFLNYLRVREWQDLYRQLSRLAKQIGLAVGDRSSDADGIHRSILAGLLSHIALKSTDTKSAAARSAGTKQRQGDTRKGLAEYIGARSSKYVLFPGSALAKKPPAAVMSAELVETSRLFARTNAAIDPSWAEPLAGDLVKRSYGEPHWEKRQGAAVAYERVMLFGVPIVEHRRVQLGRIDPEQARELFLRHALVDGEWDAERLDRRLTDFTRRNAALRQELAEVEERTRRRDILLDDEAVFEFYDRRVPADVFSTRTFESWWRAARRDNPELLTMSQRELVPEDAPKVDEELFPATWRQGDQQYALSYRFDPGSPDDGVSVRVPLALLAGLRPEGFDWQVPGLRADLVTAMIRSLPKAIRRSAVPAADWAARLLTDLPPTPPEGGAPFTAVLAGAIRRVAGAQADADDFDVSRIPAHLLMTFVVVDQKGAEVAAGKDLARLQQQLRSTARESIARASATARQPIERSGITGWDFAGLPRMIEADQAGAVIRGYPALVDEGSSVTIRVMSTPADQAAAQRAGVRRLLMLATPSPVGYVQQHLTNAEKLILANSPYQTTAALFDDALLACIDAVLTQAQPEGQVFERSVFEAIRDAVSASVLDTMFETVALAAKILGAARAAQKALAGTASLPLIAAVTDARQQLENLVYPGFLSATGSARLRRLPVYLAGITHRAQKLPENPGRDRVWMTEVQAATERYLAAGGTLPVTADAPERLTHARWMLEELRLGLFAQHLGTAEPVSLQRITKVLNG